MLCSSCLQLFNGVPAGKWPTNAVHHRTLASFENGLAAACPLCYKIEASMIADGVDQAVFDYYTGRGSTDPWFSTWSISFHSNQNDSQIEFYSLFITLLHGLGKKWHFKEYILTENDPKASQQLGGHGLCTFSGGAWDQVAAWYSNCLKSHVGCRGANPISSYYPSRLLDISDKGGRVRLLITEDERPMGVYATLSHCWGYSTVLTLQIANLKQFRTNVPLEKLPRTFLEAIDVARRLSIRYLWIDSLCILQDSNDDWSHEATLMSDVYSNSALNIMATASKTSHEGLFRFRDPRDVRRCFVDTKWANQKPKLVQLIDENLWESQLSGAPLNKRGWVFQERILSPRALHFGERQLFWECKELDACETYPKGLPGIFELDHQRIKTILLDATSQTLVRDQYKSWHNIVRLYSRTTLTRSSDKLVAISGLAKRMRAALGDQYLAGLWLGRFPMDLLWHIKTNHPDGPRQNRPPGYRAPSWSWASVDGEIEFIDRPFAEITPFVQVEEVLTRPADGHDDTGQIVAGTIRMRGTLIPGRLSLVSAVEREQHLYLEIPGLEPALQSCMGLVRTDLPIPPARTWVLPLIYWKASGMQVFMLLLEKATGQGYYRRLGTALIVKRSACWDALHEFMSNPKIDDSLYLADQPGRVTLV